MEARVLSQGKRYRHNNCTDMDIYVLAAKHKDDGIDAVVYYVHSRSDKLLHKDPENVFIATKDIHRWKEIPMDF